MSEQVVPDYRPAQPHGWPSVGPDQLIGMTLGGNPTSRTFVHNGKVFRIELVTPHPVYRDRPVDPEVAFERTLADAFGATYAFRYTGGDGRGELRVQSYGVTASEPVGGRPLLYGGDVYVVYQPDHRAADRRADRMLRWIQVARVPGRSGARESLLDNGRRANPYHVSGGRTSAAGASVVNFYHCLLSPVIDDVPIRPDRFVAESFLVCDTRTHNSAGKAVVEVYGGIRYGWQVHEVTA